VEHHAPMSRYRYRPSSRWVQWRVALGPGHPDSRQEPRTLKTQAALRAGRWARWQLHEVRSTSNKSAACSAAARSAVCVLSVRGWV